MEIILLVLKIIGIILLSLFLLILLLAALIMFYPVSYRLEAAYEESLCAKIKVHWLFHLISVTLDYKEAGKKCILRILGIPVLDFLNPKPKKDKPAKEKRKPKKKKNPKPEKKHVSQNIEKTEQTGKEADYGNRYSSENEEIPDGASKGFMDRLKELWEKLTGFPAKMKALIASLMQKMSNLYHKGIDIKEKAEKWIEVLKRERTRLAIGKAKQRIMGLLKHIMPRKWKAYVEYGFEDPGTTGQIYGYYWMFLGIFTEHLICVPDFEHKVFRGSVFAKGHMQAVKFLYIAFQFMFDKDLVYLRKINREVNS